MKWFLQFLSLGSAVLYTLLVIIDNRIPDGITENAVASEAHSNQRRLSVWGPYLPNRSRGQERQASLTTQPAHQQNAALAPRPYRQNPGQYFDDQAAFGDKLTASKIDGDQIGKPPASLPEEEIWFVVSRAARLHAGPFVSSRITYFYPVGTELKLIAHERGWFQVSDPDIETRMDLREVLSRCDPWSWPDAARSARLAKPHTSGARCTKAEACKPGRETKTPTKDREQKDSAHPQRIRQLDREGVSRVLRLAA